MIEVYIDPEMPEAVRLYGALEYARENPVAALWMAFTLGTKAEDDRCYFYLSIYDERKGVRIGEVETKDITGFLTAYEVIAVTKRHRMKNLERR